MHPNDDDRVGAAAPDVRGGGLIAVAVLGLLAALAGGLLTGGRPPFGPDAD